MSRRPAAPAAPTESERIEQEIRNDELRFDHAQRELGRHWARRMVLVWALGQGAFLLTLFIGSREPVGVLVAAPVSLVVNAIASYGIGKAAIVAPDRFPVRYGGVRGTFATFSLAVASFMLLLITILYLINR